MYEKYLWLFIAFCFLFLILFCNKKVCIWLVVKEQFYVFKNAKTNRISVWDNLCFFIFPWIISFIFVYKLNLVVKNNLAELLTTVFSIIFTVLFGFASVMISKIDSNKKIEKQVAEETFVSIVSSTILSLFAAITSILITQVKEEMILQILSFILYPVSLIIIMLLLLITKRTFLLYIEGK